MTEIKNLVGTEENSIKLREELIYSELKYNQIKKSRPEDQIAYIKKALNNHKTMLLEKADKLNICQMGREIAYELGKDIGYNGRFIYKDEKIEIIRESQWIKIEQDGKEVYNGDTHGSNFILFGNWIQYIEHLFILMHKKKRDKENAKALLDLKAEFNKWNIKLKLENKTNEQ